MPEALWCLSEKLKLAREYSESVVSTVVMIIVNSEILVEWGETTQKIDARSLSSVRWRGLGVDDSSFDNFFSHKEETL